MGKLNWFHSKNGSWYLYREGKLLRISQNDCGFRKENLISQNEYQDYKTLELAMEDDTTD